MMGEVAHGQGSERREATVALAVTLFFGFLVVPALLAWLVSRGLKPEGGEDAHERPL